MLTGQLGDVMKESAHAALSYVRAHVGRARHPGRLPREERLHLHVPAGAVPKDGPSAGNAIMAALVSLLDRPARARRRGHDRRDHAARQRAAGRRDQGEGAGRAPRRHQAGHPARAQRQGSGRAARRGASSTMDIVLVKKVAETLAAALEDEVAVPIRPRRRRRRPSRRSARERGCRRARPPHLRHGFADLCYMLRPCLRRSCISRSA